MAGTHDAYAAALSDILAVAVAPFASMLAGHASVERSAFVAFENWAASFGSPAAARIDAAALAASAELKVALGVCLTAIPVAPSL